MSKNKKQNCNSYKNDGFTTEDSSQCIGCLYFTNCRYFYNRDSEYQRGYDDGLHDKEKDTPSNTHLWSLQYEFLKGYEKGYRDGYYSK